MRPTFTRLYPADDAVSHTVFGGYFFLQTSICAYFENLSRGKFCSGALFSTVGRSMLCAISLICGRRVPSEIGKPIVGRVAVVVASLMAAWWWATKCEQHEPTNPASLVDVVLPKQKHVPPIFFIHRGFLDAPRFGSAHSASIGHLVDALKANDMLPLFHKRPISSGMEV